MKTQAADPARASTRIIGLIATGTCALLFLGGRVKHPVERRQLDRDRRRRRHTGSAATGGVTDSTDADGKGGQVADAEATAPELLIIRTGQLEIEVADLDAAAGARSRVIAVGGYVSASEERAGDDATATVTFRIPADRWDDAPRRSAAWPARPGTSRSRRRP